MRTASPSGSIMPACLKAPWSKKAMLANRCLHKRWPLKTLEIPKNVFRETCLKSGLIFATTATRFRHSMRNLGRQRLCVARPSLAICPSMSMQSMDSRLLLSSSRMAMKLRATESSMENLFCRIQSRCKKFLMKLQVFVSFENVFLRYRMCVQNKGMLR